MYSVKVSTLPAKELPMHRRVFAREIWGPGTGAMKCTVLHNVILADGAADMHVHEESEHVFIIIKGELRCRTDAEDRVYGAGEAFVVLPGVPHEVTSTGKEDGEYYVVSTPPIKWGQKI
ncbi:MAG: Cupin domain protein [Firmicutes bacterium ADurb.Bin248]|nr:MAG: Cupin domain protein [Firmicutes bacterium ADurb.Bin248]HPK15918.1 cupin domain-containing protein [Clostridia bacterium]